MGGNGVMSLSTLLVIALAASSWATAGPTRIFGSGERRDSCRALEQKRLSVRAMSPRRNQRPHLGAGQRAGWRSPATGEALPQGGAER